MRHHRRLKVCLNDKAQAATGFSEHRRYHTDDWHASAGRTTTDGRKSIDIYLPEKCISPRWWPWPLT